MRRYPDNRSASGAIYFNGYPDYWEMTFISHFLRSGDSYLDIDAKIGIYTIFAASLAGRTGYIDSFEPDKVAAQRLIEQLKLISSLTSKCIRWL